MLYLNNNVKFIFLIILCLFISSCSTNQNYSNSDYRKFSKDDRGNIHYKGHYKVGKEYKVNNLSYKPREVRSFTQVGIASWYGKHDGFHGKKTANGDVYNRQMLTAAHRTLQLPSIVKVTNLSNNKSVIVLVNDRGPYVKGRIIDISEKAAEVIGMKLQGTAKVKIRYLAKESQEFLKTLGLQKKHGSTAKTKLNNKKCTVNCHVKLVNLKHKIKVDS